MEHEIEKQSGIDLAPSRLQMVPVSAGLMGTFPSSGVMFLITKTEISLGCCLSALPPDTGRANSLSSTESLLKSTFH